MDLEFLSFIRFQNILYDSGVLFSKSSNFYKLKRGDLISRGNQFWRKSEWFGTPFLISILKVLRTKILCQSLHFNAFCPVSGVCFSDFWNFYKLRRGTYFLEEPILQNVWIILALLLYFTFKRFKHPNFLSFIRFQCILLHSGAPFYDFLNFYRLKRGDLISGENHFCR